MISRRNVFKTLLGISTGLFVAKSVEGKQPFLELAQEEKPPTFEFLNATFLHTDDLTHLLALRKGDRTTEITIENQTERPVTISVYVDGIEKLAAYVDKLGGHLTYTFKEPICDGMWSARITTSNWEPNNGYVVVRQKGEFELDLS